MGGVLALIGTLAPKLIGLIPDPNKKAEMAHEVLLRTLDISEKAIALQTYKWVDAVVKIMAALMAFGRPLGTAAMTAAGIWLAYKQIEMPPYVTEGLIAAFPTWGGARELGKSRDAKIKMKAIEKDSIWPD